MDRLGQRIRSKGIVRSIAAVATLGMVWVAAGAPFMAGF
jgi:hypothetical protein